MGIEENMRRGGTGPEIKCVFPRDYKINKLFTVSYVFI